MHKSTFFIVTIVLIALGAGAYWYVSTKPVEVKTVEVDKPVVLGTYTGTLPCADCSGLTVSLTLTKNSEFSGEGTYTLTRAYGEKGTFTDAGNWTTNRGSATDPDATLYVLDPDSEEGIEYYLKVNDATLRMLDRDRKEIDGPFNYDLTRTPMPI